MASVAATLLWWFVLRPLGIHAHPDDQTMSENFAFYTTFHAFIASFLFYKLWGDREKLRTYVAQENEEEFHRLCDDTLPFAHKFMLFVLSFYIIAAALYKNYVGVVEGLNGVFSNTFIVMLFWEMAKHLDDPVNAIWNQRIEIPAAWIEKRKKTEGA